MITINAEAHPLMSRMHKPDPELRPDEQDKRGLMLLELEDVDIWLHAPTVVAAQLVPMTQLESSEAAPATQ